jgi:hypothetical protein
LTTTAVRRRKKPEEPAERLVDGLRVVADEPVATSLPHPPGKPPVTLKGYTRLTLEDGNQVFACADCSATGERGEIMRHRVDKHGAGRGGRRKGVDYAATQGKRSDELAAALGMPLGEVLELAVEVNSFGTLIETLTAERDDWKNRYLASDQKLRRVQYYLDKLGFVPREDGEE